MYNDLAMSKETREPPDFEQAFQKLEETAQALERGGLTLAQATSLYEEGMRLAKLCTQRLDAAELKITELQNAFLSSVNGREEAE